MRIIRTDDDVYDDNISAGGLFIFFYYHCEYKHGRGTNLRHRRPVRIRIEKHRHGLVRREQHERVERADSVHGLDVVGRLVHAQQLTDVSLQRERVQYFRRGACEKNTTHAHISPTSFF